MWDEELQPRPWRLCPDGTAGSARQSSGPLPFPATPGRPGVGSAFTYLRHFCLLRPESHFRNISIQSGQSVVHRRQHVKRLTRVLKFISMDHVIPRDPQVHRILTAGVFLSSAHDCLVTDLWDNCTLSFLNEKKTSLKSPVKRESQTCLILIRMFFPFLKKFLLLFLYWGIAS